ncbi:PREDICTED: trypsin CFT-1-like isoform X2 [Papilio xuthus]|uniref:limulus clotting factor C n=1 Tax=Papilio xuthus TaxID=66420 RepID=A0A194PVB6_PAPXU|nr:PREDICTED: trypsin CFT-1-like isoform X2 [Papilio xuthus]KPI95070.1 Trypsin CFT-1 [Papilio xuthus]
MRVSFILLALGLSVVAASQRDNQRIVGGTETTITQYPFGAALLITYDGSTFWQNCGGTILNNRAILSAAHCFLNHVPNTWRIRVGSTFANSGGVVHGINTIIMHPNYNPQIEDNDICILRASSAFAFNNNVRAASIAGSNYNLADNQVVWAIGWGATALNEPSTEVLRHVQIWTINQTICRQRYATRGLSITDNMLCSGWLDVGGRDQCQRDSGGPLIHNNVVVGVCSWGLGCGHPNYPGVNARVSRYTSWIQANA